MARLWSQQDDERWQDLGFESPSVEEPIDLLFRDVVRGCLVYSIAVLLYRLRIAGHPARSLGAEIREASNTRAFEAWLRAPIPEPPEVFEAIDCIDD